MAPTLSSRDQFFIERVMAPHFEQKKLAPFYLIANPGQNTEYQQLFLAQLKQVLKINSEDHLDLWQKKCEEGVLVKDIDELIYFSFLRPVLLPYKYIFLYEAQNLTEAHLNRLLKTLEAPEGQTILFFIAKNWQNFPRTIIGRAQRYQLSMGNNERDNPIPPLTHFLQAQNLSHQFRVYCEATKYHNQNGPITAAWQSMLAKAECLR